MNSVKTILVILVFVFSHIYASAQDSIVFDPKDEFLPDYYYYKLLYKLFQDIADNGNKISTGAYGSVDTKDGRIAFNSTIKLSLIDRISFNANGELTDGLLSIFNNSNLNSKLGLGVIVTHILTDNSEIQYSDDEKNKLELHIQVLKNEKTLKDNQAKWIPEIALVEISRINNSIDSLNNLTNPVNWDPNLNTEIKKLKLIKDSLIVIISDTVNICNVLDRNNKTFERNRVYLIENFYVSGCRFAWFSIGGGIQNNVFNKFNSYKPIIDDQIDEKHNLSYYFSFDFNYYKYAKDNYLNFSKNYYFSAGIMFSVDDNFSTLNKIELDDTYQFPDSNLNRSTTKTIIAYEGDYMSNLIGGKIYFDYYKFLSPKNLAIHIFPEFNCREHLKPVYNVGLGFLYPFKDLMI